MCRDCSTVACAIASSPALFRAVSSTVVVSVSPAATVTWPAPVRTTIVVGPGVSKVCMTELLFWCEAAGEVSGAAVGQVTQPRTCLRLPGSPVTLIRLRPTWTSSRVPEAVASRTSRTASTSHALSDCPIWLAASSARALIDSGSRSVIRDWLSSSGGSGGAGRSGRGRRRRRLLGRQPRDHELGVAPGHPDVDRVVLERAGDLGRGLGQRLEQHHPGGGVEGQREALGGGLGLGATCGGGVGQVAAEAVDVRRELHDATVTSQ